jgi:ribosomal protein S2
LIKIVPGNNKSAKSLGMILYLLAKIYVEKQGVTAPEFTISDFVENWDQATIPQ